MTLCYLVLRRLLLLLMHQLSNGSQQATVKIAGTVLYVRWSAGLDGRLRTDTGQYWGVSK